MKKFALTCLLGVAAIVLAPVVIAAICGAGIVAAPLLVLYRVGDWVLREVVYANNPKKLREMAEEFSRNHPCENQMLDDRCRRCEACMAVLERWKQVARVEREQAGGAT